MSTVVPQTAAILAGGLGTRLRDAVSDRQKVVADVEGRPFLHHLLDDLDAQGVRVVVLCTGYLSSTVRAAVEAYPGDLDLRWSEEPERLGTAGALALARPILPAEEPVWVLNGDSWCETDLGAMAAWHRRRESRATLLLARVQEASRYGRVEMEPGGGVASFVEKGSSGPGWVNAGVYLVEPSVLAALEAVPTSLEREVFPLVRGLHGYRGGRRFVDIGTPASLGRAGAVLAEPTDRRSGPLVLLDRDGVINREVHYLSDPDQVELLPGAARAIRVLRGCGFRIAVITNQSPIGRGLFDESTLAAVHDRLARCLADQGARWDWIGWCPHAPEAGCDCRKPAPGLALAAARELGVPLDGAFVVGDKRCDLGLGRAIGAHTQLVLTGYGESERPLTGDLADRVAEDLWCAALEIERRFGAADE